MIFLVLPIWEAESSGIFLLYTYHARKSFVLDTMTGASYSLFADYSWPIIKQIPSHEYNIITNLYCIRKQKGDIDFVINGFHIRGRQMSTVKGIVFEVEGRGFKPPPWLGKAE